MKRRIAIQARGSTQSADGQLSTTWSNVYETAGTVKFKFSSDVVNHQRDVKVGRIEVTIPYSRLGLGITLENAILIDNERYLIEDIDTLSMWRKNIVLLCVQRNGGA